MNDQATIESITRRRMHGLYLSRRLFGEQEVQLGAENRLIILAGEAFVIE